MFEGKAYLPPNLLFHFFNNLSRGMLDHWQILPGKHHSPLPGGGGDLWQKDQKNPALYNFLHKLWTDPAHRA